MKRKTDTVSKIKSKKILTLALLIVIVVTLPVWSTYLIALLVGLHTEPSRDDLLKFKQDEVVRKSHSASREMNTQIYRVKSLLASEAYRVEAEAVGNKCYISSSGEFTPSYSKRCALRRLILISSNTSSLTTISKLQSLLKQVNTEFYPEKTTDPCFQSRSYKIDESRNEELKGVHWKFGPLPNSCKSEIEQTEAQDSDAEFSEHQDIEIKTFNEQQVFHRMKAEGKKSYLAIAFDDIYFDEVMNDNY